MSYTQLTEAVVELSNSNATLRQAAAEAVARSDEAVGLAEQSAGQAAASAASVASLNKVNKQYAFTFVTGQAQYDVGVISGDSTVTTVSMALVVAGQLDYGFTINDAKKFTLNTPGSYVNGTQMRIIVNARFDDVLANFADFQEGLSAEYAENYLGEKADRTADYHTYLNGLQLEPAVEYVADLQILRPTQTVTQSGVLYRPKAEFLPFETTDWPTDVLKFAVANDLSLREEMAIKTDPTKGSGMVLHDDALNYAPGTVGDRLKQIPSELALATQEADRATMAADAAQLSAGVYANTALGLAATAVDRYFSVPSADSNEYLILYQNVAGVATERKRYPSAAISALTINTGKAFPLKSASRAGAVSDERPAVSKAVLDIKVIGNPIGKFVRFAWYGNGTTAFGAPDYGMIFETADIATYGTAGVATQVVTRVTPWVEVAVSGTIVTRIYRSTTVEGLLISITYDKAVFDQTLGAEVVLNGVGSPGYSWIIDPACYMPMQAARVLDSLKVNSAVNFPLASYSRFNGTTPIVSAVESRLNRAILDAKITGVEEGKLVRLAYVANGTTAFGGVANYGWIIELADAATYNTTGVAVPLVNRTDPWQEVPGEGTLVTRYYRQTTQPQGGITIAVTYDKAVLAEIDGTPIVINNPTYPAYSWIFDPACYRPAEKPVAAKPKSLLYTATADELTVVWQYSDTKLMRITIGRYGPNQLNDIGEISEQLGTTLTFGGTWTVLAFKDITDWIGPYQVTAVNNGDGGGPLQSTGGHHSSPTLASTAEQLERMVYADGGLLTTGTGYADELLIKWANRIMGHNTMTTARRYILREDLMLRIRPGAFEVHGEITALEDIVIGNYFGLQCYDPGHNETIHFFNGQDNGRVAITPTVAQYSGAPASYPNAWGMSLRGSERNLTLWVDRTYGIAAPGYLPTSGVNGLMFHQANTKKAYHQLLAQGKPLALASGAYDNWRGGYIFSPSLSAAADLAQRYYNGGVPSYIVAMTAPGSAKVAVPLADINHKTTLDGAGMTVPGYVSPAGLSVKATGYSVSKVAIA